MPFHSCRFDVLVAGPDDLARRPATATTPYFLHDLGNVGWSAVGKAVSVVNGQVEAVGSGQTTSSAGSSVAWCWTPSTGMVNLGAMLAADYTNVTASYATGVNSHGQVVGYFDDSSGGSYAFLYSGGTSVTKLFPVTTTGNLADNGTFGGGYQVLKDLIAYNDGFVYNVNDSNSFTDVGGFGGTPGNVNVFAVNSNGWLTGDTNGPPSDAALFNGTSWSDIGTLVSGSSAHGRAIDSAGDIVGDDNTGTKHAWYYSASAKSMVDLGIGTGSYAKGLNDHGQIVGYFSGGAYLSGTTPGSYVALSSVVTSLSGWTLTAAWAIDNAGDIVGTGTNGSGSLDAFLLTPALSGDANLDNRVDINDLTIVLANYDSTAGAAWGTGDFNGDGKVDINDLTIVLANYGRSGACIGRRNLAAVPEPGAFALLAAILLGLPAARIGWKRR